jgi:preprotein translocase subunit SecF
MSARTAIATFRGHHTPHIDFIGRRRIWFAISTVLVVVSLAGFFIRHLNLSLEFEGGAELRMPDPAGVTVEDVREVMAQYRLADAEIQIVGEGDIVITTVPLEELGPRGDRLIADLASLAGISVDQISRNEVGPTFGGQIASKALQALIVFLALVTLYIALRFEWKMALAAQVALFHDIIITAGIYAWAGREVTPETVIAILTILGYSLYDTVVIFDKVKENTESMAAVAREGYAGVVNDSLNEVFMRSVNTSLVVVLPITSLLLFGGETLKDFAFALMVGVVIGAYSSIFLAAPLLTVLKEREPRLAQIRDRLSGKTGRPVPAVATAGVARSASATRRPTVAQATAPGPAEAVTDGDDLEPAATRPKPASRPTGSSSRPKGPRRKPPAKRRRR